jgi:hypothetical protein
MNFFDDLFIKNLNLSKILFINKRAVNEIYGMYHKKNYFIK